MNDLFANLPPVKSPRLLWMEKHGIATRTGISSEGVRHYAEQTTSERRVTASAQTEIDALVVLARKLNIKLWNQ